MCTPLATMFEGVKNKILTYNTLQNHLKRSEMLFSLLVVLIIQQPFVLAQMEIQNPPEKFYYGAGAGTTNLLMVILTLLINQPDFHSITNCLFLK